MNLLHTIIKKKIQQGSKLNYPAVLKDGNTVGWYDYNDLVKDSENYVSQLNDKSESNNHLVQLTGTSQPLWSATGITFDGVNDFLSKAFVLNQPFRVYIAFKQITWGSARRIFGANSDYLTNLAQATNTPLLKAYAGSYSDGVSLPLDSYGLVRVLFNGASSELGLNNDVPVTGNFGTANADGFTLGGFGTRCGNFQFKGAIIRKIVDTAEDNTSIYEYLKKKYGL